MTDVAVAQPAPGPHRPVSVTPSRRAGSARRTTTVDVPWPDLAAGLVVVAVGGQDLVTAANGTSTVVERLQLSLVVELQAGRVVEIDGDHDGALDGLVGACLRAGFGRHVADLFGDEGERRTLVYSVLDDLPGAFLVSGYSMLKAGLLAGDRRMGRERAANQGDICAGWATGGPVHVALAEHGHTAVPVGPAAPVLEGGDLGGWHPLAPLAPGTVRRRRQLDVWSAEGDGLAAQSHFRDSYASDDPEMVMHEYLVEATVDGAGRVASVEIDARVLPWDACPGAVASAAAVVGVPIAELGPRVRADLSGPATCTHLNSTLRALADVQALAAHIPS